MEILLVIVAIFVVTGLVILIGRALGDPQPKTTTRKFDETPADVAVLDVSDGTPLNPEEWDINIPRRMSPEEQEQAVEQFERLSAHLQSGGHR